MAVNKVIYKNETLVDLTNDSVTPEYLHEGITAHAADGSIIVGTDKGYEAGKSYADEQISESNEALEATLYGTGSGGKSWYDAFWDMYQQNGERIDYTYAFRIFNDDVFKPKYDMFPTNANQMFMGAQITNFKKILEDEGRVLDISKAKYTTQLFASSTVTHTPTLDFSATAFLSSTFSDTPNLIYVEKCIVAEKHTFSNAFARASALEHIRFEGVIANDIDFHWSPLSHDSIINNDGTGIINVLQDFSGTTTTKTLTLGTTNLAKLTDAEKAIATQKGWTLA